jgi:hypothetical protein
MDGKLSPDVAPHDYPHRSGDSDTLVLSSRRTAPSDRPRLIEHGRGDRNVRDAGEEDRVIRSRRPSAH